ncbi:MAG: TonB-dependent receptor [Chitinophagaceae bacterium]|nr:TonB-dependent receptor [Chitinophagaceae bacterium]
MTTKMNRYNYKICCNILLAGCFMIVALAAEAQTITVTGKVIDAGTRQPISGANISLKGSRAVAVSGDDGNFSIAAPAAGATIIFTHVLYERKEVKAADNKALTIYMELSSTSLTEVVVQVRKRVNTEIAVLEERKRSAVVQDGISAQQIERTASMTTTQALQRVAGITVTDDKYVAIRGLGDRSVIGELNGARLASSNPDRSAIPLDLVPASLLDNITVYKTFTPDKPADAAAGIVELKTKSIPDKKVLELIAQTGFNSNIGIGGRYNSFKNSNMGILGDRINQKNLSQEFIDLSARYPEGLGAIQKMIANSNLNAAAQQETNRINSIMQGFDQVLTTRYKRAPLNQSYSLTFGNSYNVFKKHKLGLILGGNYYRRYTDIYDGELTQYSVYQGVLTGSPEISSPRNIPNYITPNNLYLGKYQTYRENTGTETLNYGVLGGLAYRFSPRHEISVQYVGSWGGETVASNMHGAYEYTGLPGSVESIVYSLKQTFRNLQALTLQGEHKILAGEYSPRLSYSASTSRSVHNDPDYRFASLAVYKPAGDTVAGTYPQYRYALTSGYVNGYGPYGVIQAEPNGRRWRHLGETNYNYKADVDIPFAFLGQKQNLKFGFNYLFREREYTENSLFLPGSNFTDYGSEPLYQVNGNLDRLVSNEIIGINTNAVVGEGGLPVSGFIYNIQKSPNNYKGYYETNAFYLMADLKPAESWRITGGVRFENTDIGAKVDTSNVFLDPSLTTTAPDGSKLPLVLTEPNSRYKTGYRPFYSVNIIYALRSNMNFRAGYNTTLARPELREITNVFEYDPFQLGLVAGNPNLRNQYTQNLDFRWEWFTTPGEVFAVSAFGKRIQHQLVKVFSLKTGGLSATYPEYPTIQFQNEQNIGKIWGIELEAVKNLGNLWEPLNSFFLGANLMLSQSDIRKSDLRYAASKTLDRNTPKNSPLFEQAPYAVNAWLNYSNKKWGTDLTATFNIVGERLVQINLLGEPDLYSRPVPMLDFVFSQRVHKKIIVKGFAKNIMNAAVKTVYANPGTGGKWYGNEYVQRSYKRGSEFMLGVTYNVF